MSRVRFEEGLTSFLMTRRPLTGAVLGSGHNLLAVGATHTHTHTHRKVITGLHS